MQTKRIIMLQRIKSYLTISTVALLLASAGCKKGTFDINSPNPNQPSSVSSQFQMSSSLVASAYSSFNYGGFSEFTNLYMGYWALRGDSGGPARLAPLNL